MELDRYLTKRQGSKSWYARVPVPRRLQAVVGTTNKWKSLHTEDRTEATIKAVKFVEELRQEWAKLSDQPAPAAPLRRPSVEELERVAVRYAYELLLAEMDKERHALASMTIADFERYCEERERRLRSRQMQVATGNFSAVMFAAKGIVAREHWDLVENEALFETFCSFLAQATLASHRAHRDRLKGNVEAQSEEPLVSRVRARDAKKAPAGERLLDLFDRYAAVKLRENSKRPDTLREDRKIVQMFSSFIGEETRTDTIKWEDARQFRDLLFRLPVSLTKLKDFRGLSIQQAAAKAQEEGKRTLDIKTVRKHISTLSPFFAWLKDERLTPENHFRDLLPRKPRGETSRPPFDVDQVNALLRSPLFTGFASDRQEHISGDLRTRDWRFWIPLLCMFTGARIGEVAQLRIEDVYDRDGLPFIDLKEDRSTGQQTKSRKTRSVAVHPTLEKIGFLVFVDAQRRERGSGQLFVEIEKNKRGHAGAKPSRFLRDYLKRVGIKEGRDGLGSHSFRHLMADELREAGYDDIELGPLILGHSSPVPITEKYGRKRQGKAQRLYDMIAAVEFKGVDFSHLLPLQSGSAAA
jgi:integrase